MTQLETGWVARHLESDFPAFPEGYPNTDLPHPPAISMGNIANATCQGVITNMSQTVQNPFEFSFLAPGGNTPIPADNYGDELGFLRTSIEQTNAYGTVIREAALAGNTLATYPDEMSLASQLRYVAQLISGGLQTQVYVVNLGGFDTHSTQVEAGNTTMGNHANLLGHLSESIAAFQDDLDQLGIADRVLGMTFSEFGRQIKSNASVGTDHGTAAPMFLFGNCASGNILGANYQLDPATEDYAGIPMQYDFRDVYGSVLMDWFEVPEVDVRTLLYPNFVYLPVANGCASVLPVDLLDFTARGREKLIQLNWQTASEENNAGFEVERSEDGVNYARIGWVPAADTATGGVRAYELDDTDAQIGPLYYYRLKQRDQDGAFEYSPVRTARLAGSALADWSYSHAYPNPANTETMIQVYAPTDARITYSLFNQAGQRMLHDNVSVVGRQDNRLRIRLHRVPAGMYTLRFEMEGGRYETKKLMIVR